MKCLPNFVLHIFNTNDEIINTEACVVYQFSSILLPVYSMARATTNSYR